MEPTKTPLDNDLILEHRTAMASYEVKAFDACKRDASKRLHELRALPRAYRNGMGCMKLPKAAERPARYGARRQRPAS